MKREYRCCGVEMSVRMIVAVCVVFVSAQCFADERHDAEDDSIKIAREFARCAGYFSMRSIGADDPERKHIEYVKSYMNLKYAAMYSSIDYASKAALEERQDVVDEIMSMDNKRFKGYDGEMNVKCAGLVVKYIENSVDKGVIGHEE